jgi:adenine-specific DNA-methyltransferase
VDTGNDFVYKDNFVKDKDDELFESGQKDELARRLVVNPEASGRYHSDWLSMMYSRLKLARNLLSDDGVIFISIDDSEVHNLRKICDDPALFGGQNFIAQIVIDGTPKNDPFVVSTSHEYCLVYSKNLEAIKNSNYGITNPIYADLVDIWEAFWPDVDKVKSELDNFYNINNLKNENIANYKYVDHQGVFRIGPIDDPQNSGPKDIRLNPTTGKACKVPSRGWSCTLDTWKKWLNEDLILFPDDDNSIPAKKTYISKDRLDVLRSIFKIQTRKDTDYLKNLFELEISPFSNPKPRQLLIDFFSNCNDQDATYLDFFSGSGSTADALINLNTKDKGRRKFILVQIPEEIVVTGSNKQKKISKAAIDFLTQNNRPSNIAELGKERIRRAGKKIKAETGANIDYGFRVYRLDESNMQDVYYRPQDYEQAKMDMFADNVKEGRTADDLLAQVMLDWGLPLSLKIESITIAGKQVFKVADNSLYACFDDGLDESFAKEIAKDKPLRVVFKDNSFKDNSAKTNVKQLLKQLSPETEMKVI